MNDEQFYVLDSVGLVVLRGGLDAAIVSDINQKLDACIGEEVVSKFPVIELDDVFLNVMVHPWVIAACKRLIGPFFRFDHAFGLKQPSAEPNLHGGPQACQSSCFYSGGPFGRAFSGRLSVGFALSGQSRETGGFAYIPGSHKSSYAVHGSTVFAKLLNNNFDHECIQVPTLCAGDIWVFPDCLVHGTTPWKSCGTRRALYYMYSPGYMAWRPYEEIQHYTRLAKTDLQRQLLRPPYVASFSENGTAMGLNNWRTPNP